MPHLIGSVTGDADKNAHQKMLEVVMNFATSNGWTLMRYLDGVTEHELILRAPGLSGTEQIYIGLLCYQNSNADYYNILAAGFTGYVPGNAFAAQPGFMSSGVPAHNQRIDYWLTLNGQRMVLAMKVGTPVYESLYLGKMLPYARPSQYPYPLVVGGMLNAKAATRFSDSAHSCWVKGGYGRTTGTNISWQNMRLLFNSGAWVMPQHWPWNNTYLCNNSATNAHVRDTGGTYPLLPVILSDATSGVFGELDGVYYVSGFDNAVENSFTLDGHDYVVMQDVWRTGFADYYAIRMDT